MTFHIQFLQNQIIDEDFFFNIKSGEGEREEYQICENFQFCPDFQNYNSNSRASGHFKVENMDLWNIFHIRDVLLNFFGGAFGHRYINNEKIE